jgi:hypothetical protein
MNSVVVSLFFKSHVSVQVKAKVIFQLKLDTDANDDITLPHGDRRSPYSAFFGPGQATILGCLKLLSNKVAYDTISLGKRKEKRRGNRKAYRQTPQLRKQVYLPILNIQQGNCLCTRSNEQDFMIIA